MESMPGIHVHRTNMKPFAGPAEFLIPEHTRDAFFQLWCDLRTNVPKDRYWVRQHAISLQPKTSVGYIVSHTPDTACIWRRKS